MAIRTLKTFQDFAVSYDLHGVDDGKDDHAVVSGLIRKLPERKTNDVMSVTRKRVSTLWDVCTTLDRDQLYDCIVGVLQRAKRNGLLTADSITLLVVQIRGDYRVKKSEL